MNITVQQLAGGDQGIYQTADHLVNLIRQYGNNFYVRKWAERIIEQVSERDKMGEVRALFRFVKEHIRYTRDMIDMEYVQEPGYVLEQIEAGNTVMGDCITGDTEIILREKKSQTYHLKRIDDIEFSYCDYEALSYNFNREEWEFKEITGWQCRGIKEVHKIKFRNGTSEYCTLGHKFFNAKVTGNKLREIIVKRLDEIDIGTDSPYVKSSYNRVLCARKIPSLEKAVNKSDQELWVDGMYVAEGYRDKYGRVDIAQDKVSVTEELIDSIKGMGGVLSQRSQHQYVRFNKNDSVRFNGMGRTSIDKQLLLEHLSLPCSQLRNVLNGYFDGDGSVNVQGINFYTTISKKLAKDLAFAHLVLGDPLYTCDYGRPLSKYGKYPVTRLYEFHAESGYRKDVMNGVALVGIKSAEFVGHKRVYDIGVKDTHNFVSSTGMIFHNCDDSVVLLLSLLRSIGFMVQVKLTGYAPTDEFTHVYGVVYIDDHGWVPVDTIVKNFMVGDEASNPSRVKLYPV